MKVLKSSQFLADTFSENDVLVLAGPSGTGKTEITLNLATFLTNAVVVDLDFCKSDFTLRSDRFCAPAVIPQKEDPLRYADTPQLDQKVLALLGEAGPQRQVIIDLGGDYRGLKVFQVIRPLLERKRWHIALVINFSRPFFQHEGDYCRFAVRVREIFGLQFQSLVANTHLMGLTDRTVLQEGWQKTRNLSRLLAIPILFAAVWEEVLPIHPQWEYFEGAIISIKRFVRLPWEESL